MRLDDQIDESIRTEEYGIFGDVNGVHICRHKIGNFSIEVLLLFQPFGFRRLCLGTFWTSRFFSLERLNLGRTIGFHALRPVACRRTDAETVLKDKLSKQRFQLHGDGIAMEHIVGIEKTPKQGASEHEDDPKPRSNNVLSSTILQIAMITSISVTTSNMRKALALGFGK